MAKIAYILLCHKDPDGIIAQAERFTEAGDFIAIHFDARAPRADYNRIRTALEGNPRVCFVAKRFKCGWGEWSLVAASLAAVEAALEAFPAATHFYMVSGDCMPIKTARYIREFLDRDDVDYIESFDFYKSGWIKTGIVKERLIYRHFFNERAHKALFYASMNAQKRLGLARPTPSDLEIRIGSQWWCLRRLTVEALVEFCKKRKDIIRFFRHTWIPDETFFQTLVHHLVPDSELRRRTLTFLMFTDYGMPVTFYNDHYDLLLGQNYLFARKVSADALELREKLGALYGEERADFNVSNEGRTLFHFLTGRGRIGRRFAPRSWEAATSLGRDRTLYILICKKWHVAKRMAAAIEQVIGVPKVEYIFNEASSALPDLGGIQSTLEKRTRHRRALMRMLFDWWGKDRMVICLDPSNLELIQDFVRDRGQVRLLDIECTFTDAYIAGHARRVGLVGGASSPEVIARILPTIRHDLKYESDRIRDADFPALYSVREASSQEENAASLAAFLQVSHDTGLTLATTPYLFSD